MGQLLTISPIGLKLIKTYEGFRAKSRVLVSGRRVVGYGHRVDGHADISLTKTSAERLLKDDLAPFERMIHENVHAPLTQSQFDALCSLAFNIGPKNFLSSDILHALNNGRPLDAANGFDIWCKSNIDGRTYVVDALVRRRTAEKALFLRPEGRKLPASRIDLPPQANGHLKTVSEADALPIFTQDDAKNFVTDAPYDAEDSPARRRDDRIVNPLESSELNNAVYLDQNSQTRMTAADNTQVLDIAKSDDDDSDILILSKDDMFNTHEGTDMGEAPDRLNLPESATHETGSQNKPSLIAEAAAEVADQLDALFADSDTQNHSVKTHSFKDETSSENNKGTGRDVLKQSQGKEINTPQGNNEAHTVPTATEEPLVLADDMTMSYSVLSESEDKTSVSNESDIDIMPGNTRHAEKARALNVPEKTRIADEVTVKDSADKYIQRDTARIAPPSKTDQGPYAVMMVFGLTLIGGFLMTILLGPKTLLGENGPMLAAIGLMVGVMIFTGALYYFLSAIFRGRKAHKG